MVAISRVSRMTQTLVFSVAGWNAVGVLATTSVVKLARVDIN